MESVCVFCGSSVGTRSSYRELARQMGTALARRGLRLVYGGGHVGLMGAIADTVLDHGGEVVGVIPEVLVERELAHSGLTTLHIVSSMHERKAFMAELADCFVAMPGGFGTFEEFFEILTWAQLGLHRKPCGLLDVDSFYTPLIALFNHAVTEGFVSSEHRQIVLYEQDPERLLDAMEAYTPPATIKWITRRET